METDFSDPGHTQWTPQPICGPFRANSTRAKRNRNFSDKEKGVLLDGVEASYEYIKTNNSNPAKDKVWQQIAVEVTALGFAFRNAEDIRLKWTHWSSEVRRKLAKIRATCNPEELGSIDDHLTPLDQRMRALLEGGGTSDPHSGPSTPVRIKEEPQELISELLTTQDYTSPLIQGFSLQHQYLNEQEAKSQIPPSDWGSEEEEEEEYHQQDSAPNNIQHSWHPTDDSDTYSSAEPRSKLKRQSGTSNQTYSTVLRKKQKVQSQVDIPNLAEIDSNVYDEGGQFDEDEFHDDDDDDDVREMVNGVNDEESQDYCNHTTNKPHSKKMSMAQTQRELLVVSREMSGTLKLLLEQQIKMNNQLGELLKRQNNAS